MAKIIKKGAEGEHVEALKEALNLIKPKASLEITGEFDDDTLKAVRKFQKVHELKVDGIVSPAMVAKMRDVAPTPALKFVKVLIKYLGQTRVDKAEEAAEEAAAESEE